MKHTIFYVGLEVADTRYHGTAFHPPTGASLAFHCRPTLKGLLGQLKKLRQQFSGSVVRGCSEASYLGYNLQRD